MDPESTQIQQAQLAAFESQISHRMSSSNEQRSQADSAFNLCKQIDPDSLTLKLAHLLQFSPHHEACAMSAILFRKLLSRRISRSSLVQAPQSNIPAFFSFDNHQHNSRGSYHPNNTDLRVYVSIGL